jgi:hypothetical protein
MHSEPDVTRIVRSWLRTDEHESADRVLDDVLALLDTTPQRRSWWPARRISEMNTFAKLAIGAAAVVFVAVVGISLLPASGGVGGVPAISPSPAPSPSPSPSPEPSSLPSPAAVFPPAGELGIGRHSMTLVGVPFTFSVLTSGWISDGNFDIHKDTHVAPDGAGFIFWVDDTPTGVFVDPCHDGKGPALGSSAADLAAAVAAVPGTDLVSGPSDVTVGGFPAKHVAITVREDVACAANNFYLWYAPTPDLARYATALGSTIRVWIIDVDGSLVWIDGETYKGAGPEPGQAIQQIIDSIKFE